MLSVFAGFETESSDYAEIPDIDNDYASLTRITHLFFSYRVFDLLRGERFDNDFETHGLLII